CYPSFSVQQCCIPSKKLRHGLVRPGDTRRRNQKEGFHATARWVVENRIPSFWRYGCSHGVLPVQAPFSHPVSRAGRFVQRSLASSPLKVPSRDVPADDTT